MDKTQRWDNVPIGKIENVISNEIRPVLLINLEQLSIDLLLFSFATKCSTNTMIYLILHATQNVEYTGLPYF